MICECEISCGPSIRICGLILKPYGNYTAARCAQYSLLERQAKPGKSSSSYLESQMTPFDQYHQRLAECRALKISTSNIDVCLLYYETDIKFLGGTARSDISGFDAVKACRSDISGGSIHG